MDKIKVGIIGVGNCFSGLIQGMEYYKSLELGEEVIGLIHQTIGDYSIEDIEFVCAFDVGKNKVDARLDDAIYAKPNKVDWLSPKEITMKDLPTVMEAPILDGVGIYVENEIEPLDDPTPIDELSSVIQDEIERSGCEVLINYLPVGSQKATEFWAQMALNTRCAFINCIPAFIASNVVWEKRFQEKKIPIIGDDIKGQVGATIVHRVLAKLCSDRGTKIDQTYQLNVGGNTDFLNMKELERLKSKKVSKTEAVVSQVAQELDAGNVYVGPSDFIPFLGNKKLCFIRIEGRMFADIPYNIELRLDVDDKANSAGVVIDCIRLAKLALNHGLGGDLRQASSYFMKHPLEQVSDSEALLMLEGFIHSVS